MKTFKNMPIKRKVTLVILSISVTAVLLTASGLFLFQLVNFRQGFTRDLSALGEIIASHSAAPLTFKDPQAANEMLNALTVKPHITHAQLRLPDGTLFASYGTASEWNPASKQDGAIRFEGDYLIYSKSIVWDKEEIGRLFLRSDYKKELHKLLQLYAGILAIVITLSILLTVLLTSRLQRVISLPILRLAQTAKRVAEQKDYSVRAQKLEDDEIGQFTDAFNQMLEQIHGGDIALRLSQQKFETLVNSIEGVVWEADPDTLQFRFVSSQAVRLLGFPVEDWLKTPTFLQEHLHAEEREGAIQTLRQAIAERQPCSQEYRMLTSSGTPLWIRSYSTVVMENEKPVLLRGVLFDTTKEKIAVEERAAQARLLETSRQAGMAEVATGVLHNVGNVLNSVNVSVTLACDRMRKSEISTLAKVAAMLREHEADLPAFLTTHPKGKLIPSFIQSLADQWGKEHVETLKELETLAKNIEHIKEIVAMQQSYARVSGMTEVLPVEQLIQDALEINSAGFQRHRIEVTRQFEPVPKVMVDKHKVLQILINLFRNAKYAMEEVAVERKRLTLGVSLNGNDRVKISVQDNGIGIAPENLTRIFAHGFTTKRDGHGFGLHSGALAAKAMGGTLYAYSDGPGRGATLVLELPIAKGDKTHEDART